MREQGSIFPQFGFDGLFFGRVDYQDKDNRLVGGGLLKEQASIFAHFGFDGLFFGTTTTSSFITCH